MLSPMESLRRVASWTYRRKRSLKPGRRRRARSADLGEGDISGRDSLKGKISTCMHNKNFDIIMQASCRYYKLFRSCMSMTSQMHPMHPHVYLSVRQYSRASIDFGGN